MVAPHPAAHASGCRKVQIPTDPAARTVTVTAVAAESEATMTAGMDIVMAIADTSNATGATTTAATATATGATATGGMATGGAIALGMVAETGTETGTAAGMTAAMVMRGMVAAGMTAEAMVHVMGCGLVVGCLFHGFAFFERHKLLVLMMLCLRVCQARHHDVKHQVHLCVGLGLSQQSSLACSTADEVCQSHEEQEHKSIAFVLAQWVRLTANLCHAVSLIVKLAMKQRLQLIWTRFQDPPVCFTRRM